MLAIFENRTQTHTVQHKLNSSSIMTQLNLEYNLTKRLLKLHSYKKKFNNLIFKQKINAK